MLRKALFFVMVMLTVPNFASAYNYWSITASSSPSSILSSAITAPTGAGFAQSGAVTNVTSQTTTSADFTVNTPAGYVLTAVTVDGVAKGNAGGTYTVLKGSRITHTINATYSTKKYTITTSKTGNGVIDATVQVPYNTAKAISMTAGSGYQIASVTKADGSALAATVTFTGDQFSRVYTFPAVTADQTIKVNYVPTPVVNAKLDTSNQTVTLNTPLTIDGSISTSSVTPAFNWSVLPATGATVTGIAGGKATFVATAQGVYEVKLTLTADGAVDSVAKVVITATSQVVAENLICTNCHNNKEVTAMAAYTAGPHFANSVSCQSCHTSGSNTMAKAEPETCEACHAQATEFVASKHWTTTANAGWHTPVEPSDPGLSCIYRCHFKATEFPTGAVISGKADNTVGTGYACSTCHGGTLTATGSVINPVAAHTIITATVDNTCYVCHSGSKHGWSKTAYEKSSHFTGEHAKLYYNFDEIKCLGCHDSHNPEGSFTSCNACHAPGSPYGVYAADGTTLVAPHGGGAYQATATGTAKTQFVTQGAICADCHAHDNRFNAGYAESGHGAVSQDPMNAFNHYDWSARTNNGTRQNGNCDRCHTTGGFIKLLDPTDATGIRLTPVTGQPQGVLACVSCHKYLEGEGKPMPGLRIDATPAGNGQALSAGYFALFSSAAPTAAGTQGQVAANKTKIQIAFPGMKNSSICIPCHSGRSTAAVVAAVVDQAKLVNKNYTTIATSYYQHAANMGQTFISQGAYDLNNKLTNFPVSAHTAVKMGATDTQGPCVGCHYSETAENATHSLEVNAASPTCIASACHTNAPDLTVAKAQFDAGVAALDTLIRAKFAPLQTKVQGVNLEEERANVRFGRFGKAAGVAADDATAKKAYGAWYNWQLLKGWDSAAWAHNPRFARQVLNDTILYLAADGSIPSSGSSQRTLIDNAIAANSATPAAAAEAKLFIVAPGCAACHADKVTTFTTTAGYHYDHKYACANCHTEPHMTTDAALAPTCRCHGDNATSHPTLDAMKAPAANCNTCHATNDVHSMKGADLTKKCTECHAIALSHVGGKTADNNGGVRAIMPEFEKRSHHITGAAPTDAQCAVCHLEGTADANGNTVVNPAYHMKDSKIYLRNVDGGSAFVWGGTEHTAMDNFCFACHDTDGAADINTIKAFLPAATASNPFADTLTNGYDQVARAGVVDVKTQFTTTNASHHAVSGQRYKYRFSTAANAAAWAAKFGQPMPAASEIAVGNTDLDGNVIPASAFDNTNSAGNTGEEHGLDDRTLYEAGKFVATYIPLGDTANVADNSVLHCGDCHTVGQWAPGTSTNADGTSTSVAIGAHGSANDYMLRNSLGTDALHSSQTYVCFNCHTANGGGEHAELVVPATDALWAELVADGEISSTAVKPTWRAGWNALHPNVIAGQVRGYATAHAVSAFHAQCQADSSAQVGSAGTPATPVLSRVWNTTGGGHKDRVLDFIPAAGATAAAPVTASEGGNITGIACTNCHNSGLRQGWGGIHGGNATYTDGLGRSQKSYRFMPGMGNYRYAPPGGWDGKDVADTTLVTQTGAGVGAGKPMGGCYTNSAADANNGWSSCAHHGTSTAQTTAAGQAAGFRATYGGGTAATPTAAEPTVREATAGNALVTRPLKY